VLSYAGVGALPFGGVGDSGFGRIHGDDGLREFARAKAVSRPRFPAPLDVTRFDRRPWTIPALGLILRAVYGRARGAGRGAGRNVPATQRVPIRPPGDAHST
jgi:aldehyde dehydrogenase (NAD+)